ncbi:ATP-binding cassette domain-containing protein [Salinivibrio costicola]|uniref:ATP-binding cassette domain-containing protein n=1 Tax=Salinivibrio costicola TaxID=51367 RepID=UPI000AFF0BD4
MTIQVALKLARDQFLLDINLHLPGKGVTALFGRSGSGKTTILRSIAGLETLDSATVIVNGETWQRKMHVYPPINALSVMCSKNRTYFLI